MTLPDALGLPTGLHPGITAERYHQRTLGVVSKGALDLIHRSPLHYRAWTAGENDEEETPALLFGRAFHAALLEPEVFERTFAAEPDFGDCRKTANKAKRDEWRAEHAGATLLSPQQYDDVRGMIASVRRHPLGAAVIRDGQPELTVTWRDEWTGLPCKARADYYVPGLEMVVDPKSALDASWDGFRRSVVSHRYHVQDALYRAGFAAAGAQVRHFVFLAVEKVKPYAVAVYTLDADAIGKGYSAARRDIDTLGECIRENVFPGYPETVQTLDLPPWAA
jgi:hypothetical protein